MWFTVCRWPQSQKGAWATCKLAQRGPWPVRKRFIRDANIYHFPLFSDALIFRTWDPKMSEDSDRLNSPNSLHNSVFSVRFRSQINADLFKFWPHLLPLPMTPAGDGVQVQWVMSSQLHHADLVDTLRAAKLKSFITHTHTARAVSEDLERVRATIHRHAAPDFHALSHHWSNAMTTSCSIHIRARRHATKL